MEKRGYTDKKAVFFSSDALIALAIILVTISVLYPIARYSSYETPIQGDVMSVLSTLEIGEINNSYIQDLIEQGEITDLNNSVLEQIGEFYIKNITLASSLADFVISDLNIRENIGVWYGNVLISSKNSTSYESAKNIIIDRQTISGIEEGKDTVGFSARTYLSSNVQNKYFYFGGYLGEGNVTINMDYNGNLSDVLIEIVVSKDFDLYINDMPSGHYENSTSEFTPKRYDISAYKGNFHSGDNKIKIIGEKLHISGGYVKITYKDSGIYESPVRYNFPGIEGMINLYDGFYIPGQLNSLKIFLRLNSNFIAFLTIGNTTVFRDSTSGLDRSFNLDNNYLSSILNYSSLDYKTTPIRLGVENISYIIGGEGKDVDVFSVNDLSGSMGSCAIYYTNLFTCYYYCESPHRQSQHTSINRRICNVTSPSLCTGNPCGTPCANPHQHYSAGNICNKTKLALSKDATNSFIDIVLNNSGNRIGLVGYRQSALDSDYHSLSNNSVSLKNEVNAWSSGGSTCICCGINKAIANLVNYSSLDKFRSMVVMSDGIANVRCATGAGNASWDAITAACNAYNNGIKVYAVGFGNDVDSSTMQAIASCGNGSYYYSDVSNLVDVYNQIASEIIQASYAEQTVVFSGNISSILYPDSYIEFNYTKTAVPYGLLTTFEKQFTDNYFGSFNIPSDSRIIDAKVVSYSGPRWTDKVTINNYTIYNLSGFGSDYTKLGDPYYISLPNSLINTSNIVRVTTGLSPINSTSGSLSNKIVYTVIRNMTSYNSSIYPVSKGCAWNLEFEDTTSTTMDIPNNYSGADYCYYNETGQRIANENDAMQVAVLSLLKLLDIDSNGKLDVKFSEQNLEVGSSQITGIPYSWSTEVQIRRWN